MEWGIQIHSKEKSGERRKTCFRSFWTSHKTCRDIHLRINPELNWPFIGHFFVNFLFFSYFSNFSCWKTLKIQSLTLFVCFTLWRLQMVFFDEEESGRNHAQWLCFRLFFLFFFCITSLNWYFILFQIIFLLLTAHNKLKIKRIYFTNDIPHPIFNVFFFREISLRSNLILLKMK